MPDRTPYNLYVSIDGRWEFAFEVRATSHTDAFRQAMMALRPEHYDKPIKLEQPAVAPPPPAPPPPGRDAPAPAATRRPPRA